MIIAIYGILVVLLLTMIAIGLLASCVWSLDNKMSRLKINALNDKDHISRLSDIIKKIEKIVEVEQYDIMWGEEEEDDDTIYYPKDGIDDQWIVKGKE